MALFKFTRNILAGESIPVLNEGNHTWDFSFVGDIVEGVIWASDQVAEPYSTWNNDAPNLATSSAPYRIYNIGINNPVRLIEYIEVIEDALGMKAKMDLLPLQPGDVPDTYADITQLREATGVSAEYARKRRRAPVCRVVSQLLKSLMTELGWGGSPPFMSELPNQGGRQRHRHAGRYVVRVERPTLA